MVSGRSQEDEAVPLPLHLQRPILDLVNTYTAVVKKERDWWYGWVEEVPGVNAQEASREELVLALKECLAEALEMNRKEARAAAESNYSEETIAL